MFPDFMITSQDSGKVASLTHRPPLPPGNAPGTHCCQRMSRPKLHTTITSIMSIKNSIDTSWDRTSDLPICSTALQPLCYRGPPMQVVARFHPFYGPPRPLSRGIALLFLGPRHQMGWGSTPHPGRLYHLERPGTHCTGGWVGPRASLDGQIFSSPLVVDSRPFNTQLSRYTD